MSETLTLQAPARVEARPAGSPLSLAYWVGPLDLRPLALFRIGFGLVVLYDLLDLGPHLREFFTDEGLLPRGIDVGPWMRDGRLGVLDYVGSLGGVSAVWAVGVLAALGLTLGLHTRLATAVSFVVVASFQERLLPLLDRSDSVLRMLLFFLLFAPAGNVLSLDAARARAAGRPLPQVGSAWPTRVLQLQLAWIYFATGVHKMRGETWRDGTALHYAWHLPQTFSRPWALHLADQAWLVWLGTVFTLVLELGWPLLVFSPVWTRPLRALTLLSGLALHFGIWLTINIGTFSLLMPVSYLIYLEPEWAQALLHRGPVAAPAGALSPGRAGRWVAGLALLVTTWFSIPYPYKEAVPLPEPVERVVWALDLWSVWNMFSPNPLLDDYRLLAPARFEDGTQADLFEGERGQRGWFYRRVSKYLEKMTRDEPELARQWALHECRTQRSPTGAPLAQLTLYKDDQRTPPQGQPWPPLNRRMIVELTCPR